jgi:hypothetical protein
MLAIAPGPARAVLVELFPARAAHHMPIIGQAMRAFSGRPSARLTQGKDPAPPQLAAGPDLGATWPDQAALARRIRRRRSEDRSSSFRPPQVPYFSGLPRA